MKRPILFAVELVAALALATGAAYLADRFSRKANRQAQAGERIAAALERAFPALAPAQTRAVLPRPSLLHRMDLKPIPQPDPDPCGDNRAERIQAWDRMMHRWAESVQ